MARERHREREDFARGKEEEVEEPSSGGSSHFRDDTGQLESRAPGRTGHAEETKRRREWLSEVVRSAGLGPRE